MRIGEKRMRKGRGGHCWPPLFLQQPKLALKYGSELRSFPYLKRVSANNLIPALLVACFSLLPIKTAAAGEIVVRVEPVWWQYRESVELLGLTSNAHGFAVLANVASHNDLNDDWETSISTGGMVSANRVQENWDMAAGQQQNQLDVSELFIRQEFLHKFRPDEAFGMWASIQRHQQNRRAFSGTVTLPPPDSEPVKEIIYSGWIGWLLQLDTCSNQCSIVLDAAIPVWVKTTNTIIPGVFRGGQGYYAGAEMKWDISNDRVAIGTQWGGNISIKYRQLGDVLSPYGLWPLNDWLAVSAGVEAKW